MENKEKNTKEKILDTWRGSVHFAVTEYLTILS